jgi:hypothetical protein
MRAAGAAPPHTYYPSVAAAALTPRQLHLSVSQRPEWEIAWEDGYLADAIVVGAGFE